MTNKFRGIKHVCFDLDGTLVESHSTIYKTTIKALNDLKIPAENLKEDIFYERIGHHFEDIFEELKVPVPDFEIFIDVYKNQYFDFINESILYDDVIETLDYLKSKDILISLLTTKGQEQADRIIDHFGLRNYFDLVAGRRPGVAHKPSAEPLLLICKELKTKPENTLMVGDTELDIGCGKNAGAGTIAIMHGYRTKEFLQKEMPDRIIESLTELKQLNF